MCKKLMFLTSLVLLVLASSGLADNYEWTGTSPYSVLFVDPMNWDPIAPYGPDDCDDTAYIGETGTGPTIVITAPTVDEVRGPAWETEGDGDHEILLIQDALLTTCGHWRVEKTNPSTAYITLVENAKVSIGDRFLAHGDDQSVVINLSDNAEFLVTNDVRCGDEDEDYFELNMTDDSYMYAGNDDDGFRQNNGELHISLSGNAVLEAESIRWRMRSGQLCTLDITENSQVIVNDDNFRFSGGSSDFIINVTDNGSMDIDGQFRGGEDNGFEATWTLNMTGQLIYVGEELNFIDDGSATGFGQVNLHGGVINCEGLRSDTDNWGMDICGGTLIIRSDEDWTEDLEDWVNDGHITVCGFGLCGGPAELMIVFDSMAETTTAWAEMDPNAPYDPDPPCDGCEDDEKVQPDQCLSWVGGQNPCEGQGDMQHFVFLSTNYGKVAGAPGDLSALVAILPEGETTYCPGELTLGACYYWRIVEVCPCDTTVGDIWCFCVVDCMIVEDMESYDESCTANAVWEVWKDGAGDCAGIGGNGTGSSVYLATNPVHGGSQSMEYNYDSTGSERECFYSGATKTYDPPLNLVDNFEKAMVLYFYGQADNDSESMWVVLSDGTNSDQSTYGVYGDSPDDIKVEDWEIWAIDIADQFPSVNMSNVVSVEIGFGPIGLCEGEEDPGLPTGMVYFDDIQLCTTICVPKYAPDGDINDDCVVDWDDVDSMSGDWLDERL